MLVRGVVKPGVRIGKYVIGLKQEEIIKIIDEKYLVKKSEGGDTIYKLENVMLWFGEDGELRQIGVTSGFKDKYKTIGIGSTMQDIINLFGNYSNRYDEYEIPGVGGICFELKDVDDYDEEWDELSAPIEWIFVYKI